MSKVVSAILLLFCITHIHAGAIIELTDANFEHETQVSVDSVWVVFIVSFISISYPD